MTLIKIKGELNMAIKEMFNKSEHWFLKNHNSFSVEVVHWSRQGRLNMHGDFDRNLITHCWNVYVYVSPNHPVFKELVIDDSSHESLNELHCGSTYCEWRYDENGNPIVKKYGSDYMHLGDEGFEECDGIEHFKSNEIFNDAIRLYEVFNKLKEVK